MLLHPTDDAQHTDITTDSRNRNTTNNTTNNQQQTRCIRTLTEPCCINCCSDYTATHIHKYLQLSQTPHHNDQPATSPYAYAATTDVIANPEQQQYQNNNARVRNFMFDRQLNRRRVICAPQHMRVITLLSPTHTHNAAARAHMLRHRLLTIRYNV